MKKLLPAIALFVFLIGSIPVRATSIAIPSEDIIDFGYFGIDLMNILASGGEIDLTGLDDVNEVKASLGQPYYRSIALTNENHSRLQSYLQNAVISNSTLQNYAYLKWGVHEYNVATDYSKSWIYKYMDTGADDVVPEPDPNYLDEIDFINGLTGTGYHYNFLKDSYVKSNFYVYTPTNVLISVGNRSYATTNYNGNNFTSQNPLSAQFVFFDGIVDLFIDSSTNSYTYSIVNYWYPIYNANNRIDCNTAIGFSFNSETNSYNCGWWGANNINPPTSGFSSLQEVFNSIKMYWHNVNIYVDGTLWSLTGELIGDQPLVDFPDVYTGTGGDDDYIYDVWMPDNLDGEAGFDLTSLLGRIQDIIDDPTHPRKLTWEDVSDQVIEIEGENEGEEAGKKKRAVSEVAEDDEVIEDTGDYPRIPFDPNGIKDAFHGTSILAELIDACQQILPDELIVVFWGIVLTLFVLGIIKIAHK